MTDPEFEVSMRPKGGSADTEAHGDYEDPAEAKDPNRSTGR
jgi:hypothetical protein